MVTCDFATVRRSFIITALLRLNYQSTAGAHIYRFFNGNRIVQTMRFATYGPNHLESVFRRTDSILHGSCIVETMGFATYGSDQTIPKVVSDVPTRFSMAVVLWRLGVCDVRIKPSRNWFPTYRFDSPGQSYCGDYGVCDVRNYRSNHLESGFRRTDSIL